MYAPSNPYFNLSEEGQKMFGHIFPEGVPIYPKTLNGLRLKKVHFFYDFSPNFAKKVHFLCILI